MIRFGRKLVSLLFYAIPMFIILVLAILEHFGWEKTPYDWIQKLGDWAIDTGDKINPE
jgi:uncharacterized membrane protein YjdF